MQFLVHPLRVLRLALAALLSLANLAAATEPPASAGGEPLRELVSRYFAAIDRDDFDAVDALLAPQFIAINPAGGISSRAQFLSDLRAAPPLGTTRLRREWRGDRIVVAEDRGVFVGRTTWRLTQDAPDAARRPVHSRLITQHWERAGERWHLVSQQVVLLAAPPDIVSFASGALRLQAMVFRPQGAGPFPAIVYAHGNEPDPSDLLERVGPALAARGYLVFGPHRRGAGLSADQGANLLRRLTEIERREGPQARARIALQQLDGPQLDDIAAAVDAVRSRPDVIRTRIFVLGNSFGGILALLAAERGLGLAGAANFAGSAINWERSEAFRERLMRAASGAKIPVFLAQAENDFSAEPTRVLGRVLCGAGKVHRARVFPPFGVTPGEGHSFGVDGVELWADEVLGFLRAPAPDPACTHGE